MVDRALRHLLTDLTGNTHRSEFCIDKLYSPDSLRGRLGLLELRGFEMPPHPDLALAQALLIRTVLARCAEEPYRAPLIRWGSRLHEQYLLPHFVGADLADVVADLRSRGFGFDLTWFAPFLEFRFPLIGRSAVDAGPFGSVDLELRTAIEPWPVLGDGSHLGRSRPLRRLLGRATPGHGLRVRPRPSGADLQRLAGAVDADDHHRAVRRRRPLQGVESMVGPASLAAGRHPAGVRGGRPGQSAVAGRRDVPRGAPWRPVVRAATGQRQGGRGATGPSFRGERPGDRA